jgi:predicted negative regulator of RcsB-dependent stress response
MKNDWKILGMACAVVVGIYVYMVQPGDWERFHQEAADSNYNLLVEGFRSGHLSLKKEVPVGFTQLADPYDPVANEVYRFVPYKLQDLSYYKGRLYPYYGVTPALILFWPYTAVTGDCLFHWQAVMIFCVIGFLSSAALLHGLWRRYFADVNVEVLAVCLVALGLASGVPTQLSQAGIYQVAHCCGYMLTMVSLWAIWRALDEPEHRWRWLATASVAYGLAVGGRPNLLFGAIALLVPVAQAWRERRQVWAALTAAVIPISLIGLGLMLYNDLRFDSPWEFGERYVLNPERHNTALRMFSLHYLPSNFWVYFLQPARWSARFPFVHKVFVPSTSAGNFLGSKFFGVLTYSPLTWLALAAPLAWRRRSGAVLRCFVMAIGLVFATCALTLGLICFSSFNYEVDFLPALTMLAVIGILGLEHTLAGQPVWGRITRVGWITLVVLSIAFNLLANADNYAWTHTIHGHELWAADRHQEAVMQYEQALRIDPDYAEAHNDLGYALEQAGRFTDAIEHYEIALRMDPDLAEAHNNLGLVLYQTGKSEEAIEQFQQALRIQPNFVEAHCNLAAVFARAGRVAEAIEHYQQALKLRPNLDSAKTALARLQSRQ